MLSNVYYWISYVTAALVLYYLVLFFVSLRTTRRTPQPADPSAPLFGAPFFVIVVPAHDEELVIGQTVERLGALRADRMLALIMNDGSSDATAEVARRAAADDPRFLVIDRPAEIAGQGKGDVLNHAYRIVSDMVSSRDRRFGGAVPDDVVLCIVDADGWLEPHALEAVAPYFADPNVGGVQLPVRMWNASQGFLARMQDIEFIGFSLFVQAGRDPVGSVGLGGNGQFSRLSALQELGAAPWSRCLTEDLDLGLSLVERGWRNRFCPTACVAQQALTSVRPFFRQRTRWIQGHYSCWQHLPALWRSKACPLSTKIDLSAYLLLGAIILLLSFQACITVLAVAGFVSLEGGYLEWIDNPTMHRAVVAVLSLTPLAVLAITYQRYAASRLPLWAIPGVFGLFAIYGYFWGIPATFRALARIALRRGAWVKTPRLPVSSADIAGEAAALARIA